VEAIANVGNGKQPDMAPELLRYFDRFGRSLQPGERIEFVREGYEPTSLTPELRESLLRVSQAEEWTEETLLKGRVSAADVADGEFELELMNGTKLNAPLEQQHNDTVVAALAAYRSNRMLAVKGVLRKDKNGHYREFDSVEHVTLLDPLDVETRLEELASLKERWFNGKGVALDGPGLKALSEEFEKNFDSELPLPYLYPTPEGGVLAQYEALNLASDESSEVSLSLSSNPSNWVRLNNQLRQLNSPQGPE
jgi:hypothetical protein